MAAALREEGKPFADAALDFALASEDQSERGAILRAIALNADADTAADLLTRLPELPVTTSEVYTILAGAFTDTARSTRTGEGFEKVWAALETNFDAIVGRMPEVRRPQISGLTAAFCSSADADKAKAFIESKADLIAGYERNLAQGIERAKLCDALATQQMPLLAAALAER